MVLSNEGHALDEANTVGDDMIKFYSGTPGSGKSLHTAEDIITTLRRRRNVISTVNVDLNVISRNGSKKIGEFIYIPILELTPKFLYTYAFKNNRKGKEGQTLIVIDECQILFNPREHQRNNRAEWILFFTKHRHLGYNITLVSQFDRLVDRQIRSLFEYETKHRKLNNVLFLLPFTVFVLIEYWYGVGMMVSKRFMFYKKHTASVYDSYVMYDEFAREYAELATDERAGDENETNQSEEPEASSNEQTDLTVCVADPKAGVGGAPQQGKPRTRWLSFCNWTIEDID